MKKKILFALLALAMTATLFAGCSGNSDSSDSTSSVATKDSTSSDKTLKVAVFDMLTLYLIQTFNDMGYYKDNTANVEFTYYSVYSDAISAYGTGNADGNYLCGRRGCYACCKRNWQQSNRCYRYFKWT